MNNIKDKLSYYLEKGHAEDKFFNRALLRAGLIIIGGYLFGTFIAWLIVR